MLTLPEFFSRPYIKMGIHLVARSGKRRNFNLKSIQIPILSKGVRACPDYWEGFKGGKSV
jgi:hypothetical protein